MEHVINEIDNLISGLLRDQKNCLDFKNLNEFTIICGKLEILYTLKEKLENKFFDILEESGRLIS